ncbi:hypothetical protein AOQ84DRAFT_277587, partial [Glonium stellatum]
FILLNNPVLSGMLAYALTGPVQRAGLSVAREALQITVVAHLYNALRQTGHLTNLWPDLEYLIDYSTPKRMFVGAAPANAKDFLTRIELVCG